MNKPKGKITTILIVLITLILAGVAIFTAIRLYQLRQTSISPAAPSSRPKAQEICTQEAKICPDGSSVGRTGPNCEFAACPSAPSCSLSFTLTVSTPSPTPMACNQSCNLTVNPPITCQSGLTCVTTSTLDGADGFCRNAACSTETDCLCGTSSSPSPTPSVSPSPQSSPNSCGGTCGSNFNCASNLVCYQGSCRNPECTSSISCACGGTTTTTTTTTAAATPAPSLPESGTNWPTILGTGLGIFVILGALLLAI